MRIPFVLLPAASLGRLHIWASPTSAVSTSNLLEDTQLVLNGVFPINATGHGMVRSDGFNNANPGMPNPTLAGHCSAADCVTATDFYYHSYFLYDLSTFTAGTVTSALLRLVIAIGAYQSPSPSLVYSIWDVTTPAFTLNTNGGGQLGVYTDLGSGTLFGSRVYTLADAGTTTFINLDSAAIAAITAALAAPSGHTIAFGGSVQPPVPEPGTLTLLGIGLTFAG